MTDQKEVSVLEASEARAGHSSYRFYVACTCGYRDPTMKADGAPVRYMTRPDAVSSAKWHARVHGHKLGPGVG